MYRLLFLLALLTAPNSAAADPLIKPPQLLTKPTADEIDKYYPPLPLMLEIGGRALVRCTVTVEGVPRKCHAEAETPPGLAFAGQAEKLAMTFRFTPGKADGKAVEADWFTHIAFGLYDEDDPAPDDTPEASALDPAALAAAHTLIERLGTSEFASKRVEALATKADAACTAEHLPHCAIIRQAVESQNVRAALLMDDLASRLLARLYTAAELNAANDYMTGVGAGRGDGSVFVSAPTISGKSTQLMALDKRVNFHVQEVVARAIRRVYCEDVGCPPLPKPSANH